MVGYEDLHNAQDDVSRDETLPGEGATEHFVGHVEVYSYLRDAPNPTDTLPKMMSEQ